VKRLDVPFNIKILDPKDERMKNLRPVTALDIFDNSGVNFHPDGLFSAMIFGKVGEDARAARFSYINTKALIFHPAYFGALIGHKRLYMDIVSGKGYALWDDKEKDFVPSDPINGKTGFNFFLSQWKEIRFTPTNSPEKQEAQKLIQNYKHVAMTDKVMVVPAAMRDLIVGDDGRTEEDEINKIYRKLLAISNTIPGDGRAPDRDISDAARFKLQMTFNEIHDSLTGLIDGKRKLVLGKWASRHVADGTRNVISPLDEAIVELGDPGNIGPNHTVYGLYQAIRACRPVAIFEFKNNFLSKINSGQGSPVRLVNKKTLKSEQVGLKSDDWDKWFSDEGIDKLFTLFQNQAMRHQEVMQGNHYLALIYKGDDGNVRLLHDIDDLPEHLDRTKVTPVTYAELIYLSVIKKLSTLPLFVTRYPVASLGSIYPSIAYIKTTTTSEKRWVLDDNWERFGEVVMSFPIRGEAFINTLCPNMIRLAMLNADFDGDTSSANALYTDESIAEVHNLLKKKIAYVDPSGRLIASAVVATSEHVCFNLTR
jgi:hypothetical protein